MVRIGLAVVACGLALGAAAPLDRATAQRTFFGIDMSGLMEGEPPIAWRECVDPQGITAYWFDGEFDRGRLRVDDAGALCFSYESSSYQREACFAAFREGRGQYRFVSLSGDSVFVTRQFVRGVKSCPTAAPVS